MKKLVKKYVKDYFPSHDNEWFDLVKSKRTLQEQIETAALSKNNEGIMHGHQRRVGEKRLKKYAQALLSDETVDRVKKAIKSGVFHNVYLILKYETRNHYMVSSLTAYDVAQRICSVYGIEPEFIYLHTGTTEGAKNLGINTRGKEYFELKELPVWLSSSLGPADIENFLCIYKDDLFPAKSVREIRKKSC